MNLAEIYRVTYKGPDEIKANNLHGMIEILDGVHSHYLYNVEHGEDTSSKQSIQPGDDITLIGPTISSIHAPISMEIDLFGVFKGRVGYHYFPDEPELEDPLCKVILSEDGNRWICAFYAMFEGATEAHLEVKLLTNDDSDVDVYGVVTASTSAIEDPDYSSRLFSRKAGDKIRVGPGKEIIPLARPIVAVRLGYQLILDLELHSDGKDEEVVKDIVEFDAEKGGISLKTIDSKKEEDSCCGAHKKFKDMV